MKKNFALITFWGVILLACHRPSGLPDKTKKPNIVVIMVDDMGYSDLSCYGSEIQTPHIDSLAKNGVMFSQFYNAGRCCPSRASLLTGMYPHQAGMGGMVKKNARQKNSTPAYQGYLNEKTLTIAEALKPLGYATYMTGKWHVGEDSLDWPLQRGFDKYYGLISGANSYYNEILPNRLVVENNQPISLPDDDNFYFTDAITQKSVEYIQEASQQKKPFFLYVAYTAPHWPLHVPKQYVEPYLKTYRVGWDSIRAMRYAKQQELGIFPKQYKLPIRDTAVTAWKQAQNHDEWIQKMAVYAGMITAMDNGVGQIVNHLRQHRLLENTVIMFLSDNGACHETIQTRYLSDLITPQRIQKAQNTPTGEKGSYTAYGKEWAHVSNTPFRLYKHWTHEGGISTPFIVYSPKYLPKNHLTHQYAHIIDIMPTCLAIAGESNFSMPLEGKNMLPLLQKQSWSEVPIFWEHEKNAAVRKGKWKLVKAAETSEWELYDMEKDRTETQNLIKQFPQIAEELKNAYQDWAKRVGV